ncbi:hypothetical protein H8958_009009, partial [Nasalis larvatus]
PSGLGAFLKNAWDKEPVLVASFVIGGLAQALACSLSLWFSVSLNQLFSPGLWRRAVPVRDDGNMPDVPSHPQDPQGPSLEWLKKL